MDGTGPPYEGHPGLKRLIAYREGTLTDAEREEVQEHLSLCPRCTGLLRELRDFEAAAARGEAGPEGLREEAWESLARRLPARPPVEAPAPSPRRSSRFVAGAIAAILGLAVASLTLWAWIALLQERRKVADLERSLAQRDAVVAELRQTLAESERQLEAARRDLEAERAVRTPGQPLVVGEPVLASVEVTVSPRYVLRGQEAPGGAFLKGGGAVNPVRAGPDHRLTVAFQPPEAPAQEEYRFELVGPDDKVLWSDGRSVESVIGDDGTVVSIRGLGPGLYRLQVVDVAEYLLRVEP